MSSRLIGMIDDGNQASTLLTQWYVGGQQVLVFFLEEREREKI